MQRSRRSSRESRHFKLTSPLRLLLWVCAAVFLIVLAVWINRGIPDDAQVNATADATSTPPAYSVTPISIPPTPTATQDTAVSASVSLPIVNHWHPIREDQLPRDDELVDVRDYVSADLLTLKSGEMRARPEAAQALRTMLEAAKQAHAGEFYLVSAYRGLTRQQEILNDLVKQREQEGLSPDDAMTNALRTVARPGESEHHTGLAFDLMAMNSENSMEDFLNTPEGKWINAHCYEYGFIVRFPPNKYDITGIDSEPWHIRYVGVQAAKAMHDSGKCLEEYLGVADHSGEPQ